MAPRSAAVVLVALLAAPGGLVHAADDQKDAREPQEWSLQERIAARVNPQLARERVDRARRDRSTREHLSNMPATLPPTRPTLDVIRGSVQPELFLPTEVFDSLIRRGYVGVAAWREIHAKDIAAAGLPPNFWDELADVAAPMIEDMRRQHAALVSVRENPHLREGVERQIADAYFTLCRDRAIALREARKHFGPAFDRFLYTSVATGMSVSTDEAWNSSTLLQQEAGCQ
jgi:hypothetical protein